MNEKCVICGAPRLPLRYTCSDECHEKFVDKMEREYGVYKKVTDALTGRSYRVPTRDVIERGLRWGDLRNYPEWDEGEAGGGR